MIAISLNKTDLDVIEWNENYTKSKDFEIEVNFYYFIAVVYILPLIIILGIFNNVMSIGIFIKFPMRLPKRIKIFYIGIGISDLATIIGWGFLNNYLGDGLYLTTNGKFSLYIIHISRFTCRFFLTIQITEQIFACYSLMALTIERCAVICFPEYSRKHLTNRIIYISWAILILIPLVLFMVFINEFHDTVKHSDKYLCMIRI